MNTMNLLAQFCGYHPNFMARLSCFSSHNREKLLKKLKSANDKTAFLSTISEIKFGELFQQLNIEIEYDKKFDEQTPDWTLNSSSYPIICEVYRLGKTAKDQKKADFENSLIEELENIPSNYLVKIKIGKNYGQPENSQTYRIKEQVMDWLEHKPNVNESLNLENGISFTVTGIRTHFKFLFCQVIRAIEYKIGKIQQLEGHKPNEITKKMVKYNKIIESKNLPFFICVDIDGESGINHDEFEAYFLGSNPNILMPTSSKTLDSEWTELGKFYHNKHISGIITCLSNEFKVLLNPICNQIIYENKYHDFLNSLKKITT